MGWLFLIIGAAAAIGLIFLFIKAAVKSAIRDIMEEMNLKKKEEEEHRKKEEESAEQ